MSKNTVEFPVNFWINGEVYNWKLFNLNFTETIIREDDTMKKTALFLVLALLFTFLFCQNAFAEKEFKIILDGQKIELNTPHAFEVGRTMVTTNSGLFEKLGAEIRYEETEGKVWIEGVYSTVELTMNEPVAYIHTKFDFTGMPLSVEMDVAPFVGNDNVYIPLRFAVESLDALVDWDGAKNSVLITASTGHDTIPVEAPVEYKGCRCI